MVWKREMAHPPGRMTIPYGPSCRTEGRSSKGPIDVHANGIPCRHRDVGVLGRPVEKAIVLILAAVHRGGRRGPSAWRDRGAHKGRGIDADKCLPDCMVNVDIPNGVVQHPRTPVGGKPAPRDRERRGGRRTELTARKIIVA